MRAEDIMRKDVITIQDNQTVKELAQLLLDSKISGVPVLNAHGRLVGVVSQTDLVRREREQRAEQEAPAYHQELDRWLGRQGYQVEAPDLTLVRDVMTPAVLSANVQTPVVDLARCMIEKRIHRIVITRNGKLAGIVTSMDLLRLVASPA